MKLYYRIALIITVLGLAGIVVSLSLLPDIVPVHYNFAGEVDRWGSKYEYLLFPLIAIIACGIFLFVAHKTNGATKEGKLTRNIFCVSSIFELLLFFGMGLWFIYQAGQADVSMPSVDMNVIWKGISVIIGVLLIVLGNVMPKARRNSVFGLRVFWTMKSDAVWQRSQRFGGITSVIAGVLLIVLAIFLPGLWNLPALTVVIIVWLTAILIMTYRYHKEEQGR